MELVLKYNQRSRPIISLPLEVGMLQGVVMEKLPANLFTVTRDQARTRFPVESGSDAYQFAAEPINNGQCCA